MQISPNSEDLGMMVVDCWTVDLRYADWHNVRFDNFRSEMRTST
jgi:hypothetical protein